MTTNAPAAAPPPTNSAGPEVLVEVRDAIFGYNGRPVVRADRIHLRRGRCLGIFGPNGAGKTTLVRGITGLLPPLAGAVRRRPGPGGDSGDSGDSDGETDVRFGYLPQHRALELNWPMSGFDAAALAASAWTRFGWLGHRRRKRIRESLRRLDVEHLAPRAFARLSGGQQQRLLLAGALAADPQVLVLDEPTDGLDVRSRRALLELLKSLTADGLCTAIISHEIEDLHFLCDEVAFLHAAEDPDQPTRVEVAPPTAERFGWHEADSPDSPPGQKS